jgi:DNA-binding transcriptional MocR family regulator
MTIWKPTLSNREQPLYLAIANAIAEDISTGKLAEGERLPPQRDLADELRVALTTVTRAYTEAERRGLVSGEVGRGTFVRRMETFGLRREKLEPTAVDLTVNNLPAHAMSRELVESMARHLLSGVASSLLDYQPHQGHLRHRLAASKFLKSLGISVAPENLLLTAGAQHAMAVTFSTLTNPGDTVLTGEVTYSGMKSLANLLRLRLRGLAMDEEGIRPEALEAACATTAAKALYCMPTLQNPTSAVMSDERRKVIAAIAEAYGIAVIEDDSYGFLLPRQRPLRSFARNPSKFFLVSGTSKSLAPGLRVGFLVSPPAMVDRLAASLSATTIMAPSPTAEVVSRWIEDGTAERVMEWKRGEIRARQKLALSALGGFEYRSHPASPHVWLTIPEPWCVRDFVAQARMRRIALSPAEDFIAARSTSAHAVRICLGGVADRARLERALSTVAEILENAPEAYQALV